VVLRLFRALGLCGEQECQDARAIGGKIDLLCGVDDASDRSSDHHCSPNERFTPPTRSTGNRRTRLIPTMFCSELWSDMWECVAGSSGVSATKATEREVIPLKGCASKFCQTGRKQNEYCNPNTSDHRRLGPFECVAASLQ
jgi:hypothetical protein